MTDINNITDMLEAFSENEAAEISLQLEQYLKSIATTGQTLVPWLKLRPLIARKLEFVIGEFLKGSPAGTGSVAGVNSDCVSFDEMRSRLVNCVNKFNSAPFTIQRLCELLVDPNKHYKTMEKFMRAIEKNLLVISTVDQFGNKIVKETVHRDSLLSSDKPHAGAAAFNSPLMPPAPENSPAQMQAFRSPFLVSGPPDVFNSPSVKCSRSVETSRRRSSPFPHSLQHSNKKLKLNSVELPDSRSSPPEPDMSPPSVVNNMSPLSPIRSPSAEDSSNSTLPEMQSESSEPDIDGKLSISSDSPDSQVNSSGAQVRSPGSGTPSSLLESASNQVPSEPDSPLPSFGPLEDSPLPQPPSPDRQSPVLPESPASSSSPLASSPPYALQSYSPPVQEPAEPDIQCSSQPQSGSLVEESEVCSSTTVPASVADLPSSSISSPTEVELIDEDREIESDEMLVESAREIESDEKLIEPANSQDLTESSSEAHEACSLTEMAHTSSAEEISKCSASDADSNSSAV